MAGKPLATRARTKLTENDVQRAIVGFCRSVLPKSAVVFAVPNAAPRGMGGCASNGVPGLLPGVSDLILFTDHHVICAEIKCGQGAKVSENQKDFLAKVRDLGHIGCVWRSIDDARNTFKALGIETREAAHD